MEQKRIKTENRPEVVVITGASAGIGRATARRFARDGARIGLLARGKEGLEGARRDVETLGGEALPIRTDVASVEQIEAAASAIEERFGPIDIWINNAMASVFSPVKEMLPEFQPEVPAEAIYYAAHHRRREMFVGWPALKTVLGNRLAPGYVDRVLAETGYEGQQYDGYVEPDRQDNLWNPVPADFGAHGDFDHHAKSSSWLLWSEMHQTLVATGLSAIAGLAFVVSRAISKDKD